MAVFLDWTGRIIVTGVGGLNAAAADREAPLRGIDLSSWQGLLTTLAGLALFALVGIGIRLLIMSRIQRRQQRLNRQINERLRTLIAAYKVLGGSFTGDLTVDPKHLREQRQAEGRSAETDSMEIFGEGSLSERRRRIRDAVEAALSDIILLGTEAQVRLAGQAARDLAAGRPIRTHELVVSLRDFIRAALDLDPIPPELEIPAQGPTRPASGGQGRGGRAGGGEGGRQGGGGGGGGGAGGGAMGGAALGAGLGAGTRGGDPDPRD